MAISAPVIRPRSDWAAGLPPLWTPEREDDVRFLLVHHTASANVGPESSVAQLRSFFSYHTGPEKAWPDIAYNFLVDSGGQIWEGRSGSLNGPVRGDATGGSQGHALLCCFIGDFAATPPSPAATESMSHLLAWLAQTYGVSLAPGASVTFTSRGSNRWPPGAAVTTATIAGHRDMSQTTCPGDAAYALLESDLRPRARALREAGGGAPASPAVTAEATRPAEATTPAVPTEPSTAPGNDAAATTGSPTLSVQPTGPSIPPSTSAQAGAATGDRADVAPLSEVAIGAACAGALAAAAWVVRRRLRPPGQRG